MFWFSSGSLLGLVDRLGTGFCCPNFFQGPRQAPRHIVRRNFGLVVCTGNLVLDFTSYSASAPQGAFGSSAPALFFFSASPVLFYVLCSVGLFVVTLLCNSQRRAGLTVTLYCIYVCCSKRERTDLSYVKYTRWSCVVGAGTKLGHCFDYGVQSGCSSCCTVFYVNCCWYCKSRP